MSVQRIGRYEIIGELGEGGMAKVLLAHDPKFKRDVAIKVLPREVLFSTAFRERFQREAETIASLEHSAIVPVYDYGEEDGQPYLVMQQMRGGSLAERIAQGALSLADTAWIVEQIASALDKAHARGVIHRDLKPSNILFDEDGAPFLSDFGIVKVMEATAHLTSGGMIGTPGYMAPEMADAGGLSPQVDIYALGVTLFQMLTGRAPYQADTPMGLLMAHMSKPIPDIRMLRSDMPDEVQEIIQWALAKDPAERYPSAGALAADLTRAANAPSHTAETVELQLEPAQAAAMPTVIAAHTPTPPPASAPRRRSPIGIGAAVVALLLIGAIIAAVLVINGMRGAASGDLTPAPTVVAGAAQPTNPQPTSALGAVTITSAPTDSLAATSEGTSAPALLGYPGNPVTANAQWTPVIEEFDGIPMALVPAGCFDMGSTDYPNEQPVHRVCFEKPFWIDVYEITNAQYLRYTTLSHIYTDSFCYARSAGDDRPANCVFVWPHEAIHHCELRGAHLPTEAEWEYAARGPDNLIYPWGNEFLAANVVSYNENRVGTSPVGSTPGDLSWAGIYDLAGNVAEIVNDYYSEVYYAELDSPAINPQGPATPLDPERPPYVLKGGAWNGDADYTRASKRGYMGGQPGGAGDLGGRCARDWYPPDQPTPTPPPLGDPGNPVIGNALWTPVIQEFDGVPMALVPVGCFHMGSNNGDDDENPVVQVCFRQPYWIDVYEVTNVQFAQFGGQAAQPSCSGSDNQQPRSCINWYESDAFCALRGVRLPTEAEWEFAARGPDNLTYPWGNEFVPDNVVYGGNSGSMTAVVGSRLGGRSWIGAFDMSGNLFEWVANWHDGGGYGTPFEFNPQGPTSGYLKAARGGSWFDLTFNPLRSSYRGQGNPNESGGVTGFRCARDWSAGE